MDRRVLLTARRAIYPQERHTSCICIPDKGRRVLITNVRVNCGDNTESKGLKASYCKKCFVMDIPQDTDKLKIEGYLGRVDRYVIFVYPDGRRRIEKIMSINITTNEIEFYHVIDAGEGIKVYPTWFENLYDRVNLKDDVTTLSSDTGVFVGAGDDLPVELYIEGNTYDPDINIETVVFVSI
ncbi:MAG: hypothetical protein K5930_11795 [Treponemataceae bacterium]|nr:hypothetical protein [Treponemataceae bacterium]